MKKDWEIGTIGQLCDIEYGTRVVRKRDAGTKYPVYGGGGATFYIDIYNRENRMIISRFAMSEKCTRYVDGKFFLNDSGLTISSKNKDKVYNKFLNYMVLSLNDYIYSIGRGTAQRNLNMPKFKEIIIGFPPLPEQEAIVEKLDNVFEAIEQAKANIEKNIENANELFQSELNAIFSQKDEGWEEKTLGEVCKIVGGGTPSKKNRDYYNGDIFWATVRDMNNNILKVTEHKITKSGLINSSSNLIPKGEVVIATRVGLGKVCILNQDTAINQDLKGLIPIDNKFNRKYLFYWYRSVAKMVEKNGSGMTVKGVNLKFINSLKISIPIIKTQQEIVDRIENLDKNIKVLIENYQTKLADLEELKKSILEKAFAGELT